VKSKKAREDRKAGKGRKVEEDRKAGEDGKVEEGRKAGENRKVGEDKKADAIHPWPGDTDNRSVTLSRTRYKAGVGPEPGGC